MTAPGGFASAAQGLRVVEVSFDVGGEMLGKLLAGYGAEVLKVEPPDGSPTRQVGPWAGGVQSAETSLAYWFYNTSKRSAVADLSEGLAVLGQRLADADVLILSGSVEQLRDLRVDPHALSEQYPRLVVCVLTPFGLDGPYAEYRTSDLVALAAGGTLNSCGYTDHSIPPVRPADNHAFHTTAAFAQISVFVALNEREDTGRGQVIDLAVHDSLAVTLEMANLYWFYPRAVARRQTCSSASPVQHQSTLFKTRDGRYVLTTFVIADIKPWKQLVDWMDTLGIAADLVDPAYDDLAHRQRNYPHIHEIIEVMFLLQDAATVYEEGQRRGLPIAVLNRPDDTLHDEHLVAREFFQTVDHPGVGSAQYPGPPVRFSAYPPVPQVAAPPLGSSRLEDPWS